MLGIKPSQGVSQSQSQSPWTLGVPVMGRFLPLYIRRSDGQLSTSSSRGREPNQPTKEQLDSTPDKNGTSDYYRLVAIDEPKHLDWRRKLGGLLARETDLDQSKAYILASFPENYRLYEHVKTVRKNNGEVPKTKTHAGGGNDRQDAYLYGHPWGRKKRYRSPADYFHHLFWLATSGKEPLDTDDCACKICTPEELDIPVKDKDAGDKDDKPVLGSRRPSAQPSRPSSTPTPAPAPAPNASAPSPAPAPAPAQNTATSNSSASAGHHTAVSNLPRHAAASGFAQQPTYKSSASQPLPKPLDYDIDSRYGLFIFRQGEMVWYDRRGAWGLGVVTERSKARAKSHYKVQPLSWPGHETDSVLCSDTEIRPWLAWSVPPFTHQNLNNTSVALTYETFDFPGLVAGKYGPGNVEIDASILAAKTIDASWTPFSPESRTEPQQGVIEIRWTGLYLGAEKIWLNDPVRLQNTSGDTSGRVLVVRQILERHQKSAFNAQSWSTVNIIGDVFVLQRLQGVSYSNVQNGIVQGTDCPGLPSRMLEDLRRSNNLTFGITGIASCWKPIQNMTSFEAKEIRGRWYESTLLSPLLLNGVDYEVRVQRGEVPDTGSMMNSRGDCNSKGGQRTLPDSRKQKREQAIGRAMPAHTIIVEGIDNGVSQHSQPLAQQPQANPTFQTTGDTSAQASTQAQDQQNMNLGATSGSGFEEFMNLDSMSGGDVMGGFDQSYL